MNKKLKLLYENAQLNPDEPIFSIGEVVEIIKAGSGKTIRDYDTNGITSFRKNSRGDRIFSRNDIAHLKNLRNLGNFGFKLKALKFLFGFLKSRKIDAVEFINEFSAYCVSRQYKENNKK